ncbi:FAD-dependent oxidoreductase [Actinoplanes sp. NPDC051494]|uniref:FAD-dependent oxidoreductase n=1 Tax=Actinoplanes sp. NPDC051494 TaxID=3363907 RepID=UPI0037AFAA09
MTHIAILGAGPTGLFMAIALARRGHRVTVVDRDPGPAPDGGWDRRGVPQFHHPHGLRQPIMAVLDDVLPDFPAALFAAGAEAIDVKGHPAGIRSRRLTFERVLRATAVTEPGVTMVTGHAGDVLRRGGRAAGLLVDGAELAADLVVDASGRAGRLGDDLRAPESGGDCGVSYVSRQYRLRPGAAPGPVSSAVGLISRFDGYLGVVFVQDAGTVSVSLTHRSTDDAFAALRFPAVFEAVTRVVPGLAEWTEPGRSEPITRVLPGVHLRNTYRGQLDERGRVALPGLVHAGDAVCTTNPTAGRGIATSLAQARALVRLLGEHPGDVEAATLAFDDHCTRWIRPWFEDHLAGDPEVVRQLAGEDLDLSRPLASVHITAAADADPALKPLVGPYLGMLALPSSLAAAEPGARRLYESGWRPSPVPGPSRAALVELIGRTGSAAARG